MLLAIDAGNTNIVASVADADKILHSWRCKTDAARTSDEYIAWLHPLFERAGLKFSDVKDAIISSVVPDANFNLVRLCRAFNVEPLMVGADTAGIKVALPRPQEVGADRLVNAVAIIKDYQVPAIVIDFGTATTFDIINEKGEYCGGAIAPGANLSMVALHMAAAKLPRINIAKPQSVQGTDTVSAMQAGVYWGYVGLIEKILERTTSEMKQDFFVIATGGLASLFANDIPAIKKIDQDLTLRGLLHIYNERKRK